MGGEVDMEEFLCSFMSCAKTFGVAPHQRSNSTLGKKAILQRGSIEHEQIIYERSNRRMKQLMDWLSNSH